MAANFPGAGNAIPGVYSEVNTLVSGVSVPAGVRLAVIIGEGAREERLISNAVGGGSDGFNTTYTSTTGSDGRHFLLGSGQLSVAPVVENRTRLFKNGIELTVLEGAIDGSPFSSRYNAKVDPDTGEIELQPAYLVDQGGRYYRASSTNVGDGYINNLVLVDANAPAETWTIRCSTVRRDGYGTPIDGYARFIARGSVSGILLDGYGNQVVWTSNGTSNSNGILQFSISEGSVAFREGDSFTVEVAGGALLAGDDLDAIYISVIEVNQPQFFTDINKLKAKHGSPSLTNRLSLGAQLAFANGTPGVWAIQAAPAVPRRVSHTLVTSANGEADIEELSFVLPLGVVPDADSNINFFITDAATEEESQIIPNKVAFYDPTITANPAGFVFGGAEYDYSYTVVLEDSVQKSGTDGELTVIGAGTQAYLASDSVAFDGYDVAATRSIKIVNATNTANNGTWSVVSISEGVLRISRTSGSFVSESSLQFQVLDSTDESAVILFHQTLALGTGDSLRATVVDTRDADFFDVGWLEAYEAAEKIDIDIVVPLPSQTISAIFQTGKVHVESQSNIKNKHERVLFIGAIQGLTPDNVVGTTTAAVEDIGVLEGIQGDDVAEILAGNDEDLANYGVQDSYGETFRVVYFYPDQIVVQIGGDRTFVDGFFMAAAGAGYISGQTAIAEPLTNKILAGFTILNDKLYAPIVIEDIASSGITLLQPVAGGGRVIWGKTTTISNFPEEEEISIVFIRDRIAKSMRVAFRPFVGKAETPTFQATLYAVATSMMQSFITQRLITDFRDLVVERDSVEPRQFNITVAVQPVYPVNWIYIQINIGRLAA
jgi:hypothetical protein